MAQLLPILLEEFHEKLKETAKSLPRTFTFPDLAQKINVAIGMRRVGKTYALLQKITALLEQKGMAITQILYLNLEDDRLVPCTQKLLRQLIEGFYTLYPENHDRQCYLFLDEIQNVEDWPILIRRIFDTKKVHIYLTGSSAKLLSKEIHTSLRGRALATEIWPYSFSEYLQAHQVTFKNKALSQKNWDLMQHHLQAYLESGGFPETIGIPEEKRRQILQEYVDIVIIRDIVERYNITNITLIKYLIKFLLNNAGGTFSINKFFNDLKSQGLMCSKNTLYDYLEYVEDAYLTFTVPLYSESIRKTHSNPRKIYAIDPGLVNSYHVGLSKNYGHLFENLIFLELRRQGHKVFYYLTQERYEVDFLSVDLKGKMCLYQVVWEITDTHTMERETRALKIAEKELNLKGTLITPSVFIESN